MLRWSIQFSDMCNCPVVDGYGNLIDDSEWRREDSDASDEEPRKDDAVKIEKFRELIRSLQDDKPSRQDDEEFEMEVTWEPGIVCVLLYVSDLFFYQNLFKNLTKKKEVEPRERGQPKNTWIEGFHVLLEEDEAVAHDRVGSSVAYVPLRVMHESSQSLDVMQCCNSHTYFCNFFLWITTE